MSQPGYGSGPYPPDNPQQGWGGPDQVNQPPANNPPPGPYGQPGAPQPGPPPPPVAPTFDSQPSSGPGYGQQPPSPSFGEQPSSGPGYGQQPPGPSFGEQPSSGPGYGQPVSPFGPSTPNPTMALPETPGGPRFGSEPVARKRGPWIPVLAATTAVFLIVSVAMTVLFVNKNGQYNTEKNLASERKTTISKQDKRISKLNGDLSDTKDELDKVKQELSGTQNQNKDLTTEKNIIAKCLSLLEQALDAASKNQVNRYNSLVDRLQQPCTKAQGYL